MTAPAASPTVREILKANGGNVEDAMAKTGASRSRVQHVALDLRREAGLEGHPAGEGPRTLSRLDILATHDISTRLRIAIREGIKQLKANAMIPDPEFRTKVCHMRTPTGWRDVRHEQEFLPYQFRVDAETVYWGTAADVEWATGPNGIAGAQKAAIQ